MNAYTYFRYTMEKPEFSEEENICITKLTAVIANVIAVIFKCNIKFRYVYNEHLHIEYENDYDDKTEHGEPMKEWKFKQLFDSSDTVMLVFSEYHMSISFIHPKYGLILYSSFSFMNHSEHSFEFYRDIFAEYELETDTANLLMAFEEQGIACANMYNNYISTHCYYVEIDGQSFNIIPEHRRYYNPNITLASYYWPFRIFKMTKAGVVFDTGDALGIIQEARSN